MQERWYLTLSGVVQGIGLRPLLYRLAFKYHLSGWVLNTDQNVILLWQGIKNHLEQAVDELTHLLSAHGKIQFTKQQRKLKRSSGFKIKKSKGLGPCHSLLSPDIAVCSACLTELFEPTNRRYQYPFITCAHCGPRYTICKQLPYDRQHTTMAQFTLCSDCKHEYDNPLDRRFHAQILSCWQCGPKLWLCNTQGTILANQQLAISASAQALLEGKIIAAKGIGGFHLMALASNQHAIEKLRLRKLRPHKPFALMVKNINQALALCEISELQRNTLSHLGAPIVILRKKNTLSTNVCDAVAPNQTNFGIMLAYTPLQHLILDAVQSPLVVTSANLKEEPICFENNEALSDLKNVADLWLCHDRDIFQPLEDSIVQMINNDIQFVRRARGFIPFALSAPSTSLDAVGVGGHLKNTIACHHHDRIYVSPYIGDLTSKKSIDRFQGELEKYLTISVSKKIACDLHHNYASTYFVKNKLSNVYPVGHHQAHILAVMAEHQLMPPVLGFAWDGIGAGTNGELWGCETFTVDNNKVEHVATLQTISLPGGEIAIKEPRRIAISLLYHLFGEKVWEFAPLAVKNHYSENEQKLILQLLKSNFQNFACSSMGRLFDGISCLLKGIPKMTFEGQAALYLEQLAAKGTTQAQPYPVEFLNEKNKLIIDWRPMLLLLLDDLAKKSEISNIANQFHHWCKNVICHIVNRFDYQSIILSGGVFQNKLLSELATSALLKQGYQVYCANQLPSNDGALSVGQVFALHCLDLN